jgi:hypothetical protein
MGNYGYGFRVIKGFNNSLGAKMAQSHYNRVIADGGVVPAGVIALAAAINLLALAKNVRTSTEFNNAILVFLDPHLTGYKLGAGTGVTLGQAAEKVYALNPIADSIKTDPIKQPLLLTFNNRNYYNAISNAGNDRCDTPAVSANDLTGDFEIISETQVYFASNYTICSKAGPTVNVNFLLQILLGGTVTLYVTVNGTTLIQYNSTATLASVGYGSGDTIKLKVTRNQTTGEIKFFHGNSYTQLGATVSGTTSPLHSSTANLIIGNYGNVGGSYFGKMYYFSISKTIGGAPTQIFNPEDYNPSINQNKFTSSTGEVWTIVSNLNDSDTGYHNSMVTRTSIQGDGIDDFLQATGLSSKQYLSTYIAVKKFALASSRSPIFLSYGSAGNLEAHSVLQNTTNKYAIKNGTVLDTLENTTDLVVVTSNFNNASSSNLVNDMDKIAGSSGNLTGDSVTLFGKRGGASQCSSGIINTVIISNTVDTVPQNTAIYNAIRTMNGNAMPIQTALEVFKLNPNEIWVRSNFNNSKDLAQLLYAQDTSLLFYVNGGSAFGSVNVIDRTAPNNSMNDLNFGEKIAEPTDDRAPSNYNGTYIAANHGCDKGRICTVVGHGKTTEDIGSEYSTGGNSYYIIGIQDANNLIMLGENIGTNALWDFRTAITGNYIYVRGGVNNSNFTVTAIAQLQVIPATKNISVSWFADGVPVSRTTIEAIRCNVFEVVETYDIVNLSESLDYLIANTGTTYTNAQLVIALQQGGSQVRISNRFQYQANGAMVTTQEFESLQQIDIGYYGYIQMNALTNLAAYPNTKLYYPKTLPQTIGARVWDLRQLEDFNAANANTSELIFPPNKWEYPTNAPSRFIEFLADAGNVRKIGFAGGYVSDIGIGATRSSNLDSAGFIFTSRKIYPFGIDTGLNPLPINTVYAAKAFRQYFDATDTSFQNATSITTNKASGYTYFYIDYHQITASDTIFVGYGNNGKAITIVEKSANVELLTSTVVNDSIQVSMTTGNTGFIVVKFNT